MIVHAWQCECSATLVFDPKDHTTLLNMARNHGSWPQHDELSPGHVCKRIVKPFAQWAAEPIVPRLA